MQRSENLTTNGNSQKFLSIDFQSLLKKCKSSSKNNYQNTQDQNQNQLI